MSPITTTRKIAFGGEVDGDWQIVAEGIRGEWQWPAGWNAMALTWFWDRVGAGSIYAAQGRTPGYTSDRFTLYAKLGRNAIGARSKAA